MEDGYPGDMTIKVIHTYDVEHRWTVEYEAKTNQDTLFNPTNHVYFNLNRDNNVIDNHKIKSEQLNMYPIDRNNLIENTSSIDLLAIFKTNSISFSDIFNSDNELLKEQIGSRNGLDHPLMLEINNFSLKMMSFN